VAEDFSNEGLYRLLRDMKEEHGEVLNEIREETRRTNGRVSKLEERTEGHARELGRLNSAVFTRPRSHAAATSTTALEGESLSIKFSPKLWTVLAAAGGVLFSMLIEFFRRWMATP
jgi:hypothetical protein